jgi:diguanylate cyclase (GGDEF)-like protein
LYSPYILIADDDVFFRKLYGEVLSSAGYRIATCADGCEAIALMQQQQFDLILTDMVMPGADGLQVLKASRLLENPADVILVTSHASLESAIDALKNGARDYLVKPFNPDELQHVVKACLEQRRLLVENDHLHQQIQLFQLGQNLSTQIDLELLIPLALDALLKTVRGFCGCAYNLRDDSRLESLGRKNISEDRAKDLLALIAMQGYQSRGLIEVEGVLLEQLADKLQRPLHAWLLLLGSGDSCRGGILICCEQGSAQKRFAGADLRYLWEQISIGYNNSSRYQEAQELMYTDDLTGLYNHRYLLLALDREIKRSHRYRLKFSLLFLDLDHFKDINDRHGHLAGSQALKEVGRLLQRCVRDVDTLFRFGGDEFAAVLVETDDVTARVVAERIRKMIEGHAFLEEQGMSSYVTVTAGYATFPNDATEKVPLLDLADRAMYAGKASKNVICSVADLHKLDSGKS